MIMVTSFLFRSLSMTNMRITVPLNHNHLNNRPFHYSLEVFLLQNDSKDQIFSYTHYLNLQKLQFSSRTELNIITIIESNQLFQNRDLNSNSSSNDRILSYTTRCYICNKPLNQSLVEDTKASISSITELNLGLSLGLTYKTPSFTPNSHIPSFPFFSHNLSPNLR